MADEATSAAPARTSLAPSEVYGMAVICVLMGLVIGYLLPCTHSKAVPARISAVPAMSAGAPHHPDSPGGRIPTLQEMKHMADKQAEPLLQKLKADPKNSALLAELGAIYHSTHQFKQAADYYGQAVELDPKSVELRGKLAASMYRNGEVDAAIAQLNRALTYNPSDANALFNLGMIKLQGKRDGRGALATWQRLLKSNPQLSADRKAQVQKLMADVLTSLGDQVAMQGGRVNDARRAGAN